VRSDQLAMKKAPPFAYAPYRFTSDTQPRGPLFPGSCTQYTLRTSMANVLPNAAVRLEQARQEAIRAAREGVLLTRRPLRPEEEPRSYLGGLPHLREDLEWPVSKENGRPLTFIAQIELRDVPRPAGVFFPAEGLLWFFVDISEGEFTGEHKTRVLFDPHPRTMAGEREAPADLPPLDPYDDEGWQRTQHPRAFVAPKAALLLDLIDTFHDRPYRRPATWEDFFRIMLTPWHKREEELDERTDFGLGVYSAMIRELRAEAIDRAIGQRTTDDCGSWWFFRTGCREAHWPATSIEAEYALMRLSRDALLSPRRENHACTPEARTALIARLQDHVRILRDSGPRPLAQSERAAVRALVETVRRVFVRTDLHQSPGTGMRKAVGDSRRNVQSRINDSYRYAVFDIVSRMPEVERYVPAEMLDPYWWHWMGVHQMFGHAPGLQGIPHVYEHRGFVLLLQISAPPTMDLEGRGILHFWIPRRDLARGRFDRVEGSWETD
jgi:hypothetical protein